MPPVKTFSSNTIDLSIVQAYVEKRLNEELSPSLYYHGLHHTLDVCESAARLANLQGISEEETIILMTAAWFHDIGFIEQYRDNEPVAARIAAEVLPDMGFDEEQVKAVQGCILATSLPQKPKNLLEKLLCDADLDYLGRVDFYIIAQTLRREWYENNVYTFSLKTWYELQLKFISGHSYHTEVAQKLRKAQKQVHINEITELLELK